MSWKRNLAVIWFAEFTSIIGFAIAIPILPLYVQELGVTDPNAVTFWSGLIYAAHAVAMAIMAPIWGSISDRYGRKLMVERAMFGGAVVMSLMGFAPSVFWLVVLRALQGMLTGTVTAATTLVASSTPRERSGFALGVLQMGIYSGASVGPLVGGLIADSFGFRYAFWTTGGLLLIGGLLVAFLVREEFEPTMDTSQSAWKTLREGLGMVIASQTLLSVFGIRLMMRMASRLTSPILPLFVQELTTAGRVATRSGLVTTASAGAGAVGAILLGWASDRVGRRSILLLCALASAILYVPQFFVTNLTQLLLLQLGSGFAMGGILATLSSTLASASPEGKQGAVYGLDATAVSAANAVGPMLGTSLAVATSLPAPFLGAAALFAVAGLVAARLVPRGFRSKSAGENGLDTRERP
jgi:DHA1 family multidrug resistance protein-like MFS transporter